MDGKETVRDLVRCKGVIKALVASKPIGIFYPRDRKS